MTREKIRTIWTKSCVLWDSHFNLTLYQNVMPFHQTIDFTMKFRDSFIINDPPIDEKHQISPSIHPFQRCGDSPSTDSSSNDNLLTNNSSTDNSSTTTTRRQPNSLTQPIDKFIDTQLCCWVRGSTGILSWLNLTFGQGSPSLAGGRRRAFLPSPSLAGGGGKAFLRPVVCF